MKTYDFTFESEYGLTVVSYQADNIVDATRQLKDEFPEDHGADGFWTSADQDDENPINW